MTRIIGHKPIKHGTERGYERHRQLGTWPCAECFNAVGAKPLKKARRKAGEIQHGTLYGYRKCKDTLGGACDQCREASRLYSAQRRDKVVRSRPEKSAYVPPPPTFDVAAAAVDYQSGTSIKDLAPVYGVSRETMRRQLVKAGVQMRPNHKGAPIDAAQVVELYGQGLILSDVAARLGISYSGAYKALRAAGLTVRDDRGRNQWKKAS